MRIVFILLLLFLSKASAEAYHLEIFSLDESAKPKNLPDYKRNPRDSFEAVRILKQMISSLHEESYIGAHVDTILFTKDSASAYIFIGERFSWVKLRKGNIDDYLLDRSGFRERFYRNKPFRYKEYNKLEKTFIQLSENNGFPFARIRLDSLELTQKGISAALDYQKGPFFTFDSISISGKTKTKKRYLMRHIRIYKGQTFSQQRVDDVDKFIKELSFITQTRPPQVVFAQNKATVTLFLSDKKVNQIDGIVGFLPGSGANKKLLVTGQIDLALRNLFGTGKGITI
ncbi:MAG TPA: POTRA domain-containing protein, partial [Cytophagaceae bacterium]|nr:POTRA domain-containing protein [Cytophagaceae bacterium]